jgi:hypothetical protein
MATKRAVKKASSKSTRSSVRFRSSTSGAFAVRFPKSSPAWETNLENNLVEEGFARAKAREMVRLAAS